jgi:hypothetical protein
VSVRRKFCGREVFQKIQDGGLNGFFHSTHHLGFFEKPFFHKICVLPTPNENKKKIEKMLDTFRVLLKNLILVSHFGSNPHF